MSERRGGGARVGLGRGAGSVARTVGERPRARGAAESRERRRDCSRAVILIGVYLNPSLASR